MLSPEIALSFFGIAVLLALAPGPDNLFVLMQSARWGRRAGMMVVLGLCTGLIGHTLAVAAGLAAVLATSEHAFLALKLAGAAYLLYLAWGAIRSNGGPAPAAGRPERRLGDGALYRRGIFMNLTNPKVSLFFLAFLPQFTSPANGSVTLQIVTLGLLFMAAALLVFSGIAVFSGACGSWLQRSVRARRWLDRIAAAVFVGLAARLALSAH